MKSINRFFLSAALLSIHFLAQSQVVANNESLVTGPSQKLRYDVVINDVIPCNNHTLRIVSVTPLSAGTAIFDGDYLEFTPATGITNQTVNIVYELSCPGGDSDQATVSIFVRDTNLPLNVVQTGEECIDLMPEDVAFNVSTKFVAYSDENHNTSHKGGWIQPFSIPLVGDLNGDGKPEIIALGNAGSSAGAPGINESDASLNHWGRRIYIFDGQTGNKVHSFELDGLGTAAGYGGNNFQLGTGPYHQSPSYMVIADVDNDGLGEIILCQTGDIGRVYCLKPTVDAQNNITGLTKIWDGNDGAGTTIGHKWPLVTSGADTYQFYGQPIPQIMDMNGDGIPELVVYNKIYNAQTGVLLMEWGGPSATLIPSGSGGQLRGTNASSATANGGSNNPGNTTTTAAYSDTIRARPMVGRRPGNNNPLNDSYMNVPAIVDLDGDGIMEVITGARIHKFEFNSTTDHRQNKYRTLEAPTSVQIQTGSSNQTTSTFYLNDGFTRVADIDGDGKLDIIVFQVASTASYGTTDILMYVWDWETQTIKAATMFESGGNHGVFGIPLIGDINDRLDGRDFGSNSWTKKLPEVVLCMGRIDQGPATGRSGVPLHPQSAFPFSATSRPTGPYHVIAFTYDAGEADLYKRMKLSWVLGSDDNSNSTGITMFDFNNDGAFDLCYRDMERLRVISPKLGNNATGKDYVPNNATSLTNNAILFSTEVNSNTGTEAPAIADINMDGSADIIVTGYATSTAYKANIFAYEYNTTGVKWAPCPPVWNQALYNPLYINENLTVPAKPIAMLSKFYNGRDSIQPYNGAWIQQPIVREGEDYVPIYRHPDAVLVNLKVTPDGGNTQINLTVRNDGLASVNALTPVYFYHTAPGSSTKLNATVIPLGVDIFPGEKVDLTFTVNGTPSGYFTHCHLVHDGINFPATGYTDCRSDNNDGYTTVIRAVDDYYTAFRGIESMFNVLANDTVIGLPMIEIIEGPHYGTADTINRMIAYTPNTNAPHADTIKYLLRCEYNGDLLATTDTAYVYIRIASSPDNINEADCVVDAPTMTWGIQETTPMNTTKVNNYGLRLIGDIDNDNTTEIIAYGPYNPDVYGNTSLEIFYFDQSLKNKSSFTFPNGVVTDNRGSAAMARYNDTTYLIVPGRDGLVYAYNVHGAKFWNTTVSFGETTYVGTAATANATNVGIADFNNDGIPEVYAGNKIFSIIDGSLICNGGANNKGTYYYSIPIYSTIAVDIDGDGVLELIAGTQIYDVNIETGTMTLKSGWQLPASELPANVLSEGQALVADIDLDGSLDIVVISRNGSLGVSVLVWKPLPNNQSKRIGFQTLVGSANHSTPMIGNIDNTPHPEIIFITSHSPLYMYALSYNGSEAMGSRIVEKWRMSHTDSSGSTGTTLFDFSQSGISEIVYRDQTKLRIFDGSGASPVLKAEFDNVTSPTVREYPIVADIDNDGQAEIIVTGSIPGEPRQEDGYLRIFKASENTSWASARKVWNQYMYNAVHVNEDLTIPSEQLDPATVFPGTDGILGTTDDVRPYNAFLQQQTALSKNGMPLWLTPNGETTGVHTMQYDENADSLIVTIEVRNIGDAAFQAPFYITAYKNNTGNNQKHTIAYNQAILQGETVLITFGIPNFKQNWYPFDNLVVQINDNGDGTNDQVVCEETNRIFQTSNIIASDDWLMVFKDYTDQPLDVTRNDILPTGCTNPTVQILPDPAYTGMVNVSGSTILYTPVAGAMADTLRYRVYCDDAAKADTATVYITIIPKPDNLNDADCYITPPATNWSIKEVEINKEVLVQNYGPLVVGDIDQDGIVEIIGYKESSVNTRNYESPGLKIFYYDNVSNQIKLKNEFLFATTGGATSATFGAMAIARYNNTGYIVVAGTDKYLYAYSPTGARLWKSNAPYESNQYGTMVGIADFNNDGVPEVFTGNQIFSLSNGVLLCDGGTTNSSGVLVTACGHSTVAADMNGDGRLEIVAGVNIYQVTITNNNGTAGNSISLLPGMQLTQTLPANAYKDGATQVVDIDNDGILEVVVMSLTGSRAVVYVWKPQPNNQSYVIGSYLVPATTVSYYSIPMLGNIDDDPFPEIVFITNGSVYYMYALKFNPNNAVGSQLSLKWNLVHTDGSGCTGATLFDFNQDGMNEIVYRDQTDLRIIDGSSSTAVVKATFNNVRSGTLREYPVIADVDGDGQAEIVVSGWDNLTNPHGLSPSGQNGYLRMFKTNGSAWAPARKVWNQYAYNAVNVNEDLTIPAYWLNPATVFPGEDGMMGTADDVRPYNNFLQQQTMLNKGGGTMWLTPDVYPNPSLTETFITGDSVCIRIGMVNQGDAAIGSPIYVALYKESVSAANFVLCDSANVQILPGETGYVDIRIPNFKSLPPMLDMAIRLNDNGITFMYQPECDSTNNVMTMRNPAIHLLMEKDAELTIKPSLSTIAHNGTRPNPVAILYGEEIEYTITGVNVSLSQHTMVIEDTIPAYLKYVTNTATTGSDIVFNSYLSQMVGMTEYDILKWTITNVGSMDTRAVTFKATPRSGVCSSQPEFMNRAWVTVNTDIRVPTNYTYHQGACVGFATFSSGIGGVIHNAAEQALDYMTSPRSGIVVVPDDGYRFVGWSHDDYISLRGERVEAASGIMQYDTLTVFGNVELHANFALEEYPIRYHLNEGKNAVDNPPGYTIQSDSIILAAPTKPNDVFTGWTGSNGDTPQTSVVIPKGSTGELDFYANYLHSGRESDDVVDEYTGDDRIWSVHDELYIRTSKVGALVRVYTLEGILQKVHTITVAGDTKLKLPHGLYIVTLDDGAGQKVRIR